jgi:hypothetical protein
MNPSMINSTINQKGSDAAPQLPAFLTALGQRLPAYPGSLLCVAALNLVLRPQLPDDVRNSLLGRHMRVRVSDAGVAFDFAGMVAASRRAVPVVYLIWKSAPAWPIWWRWRAASRIPTRCSSPAV